MLTTQQTKTLKQLDETLQYYWQQHTQQPANYGEIIHIILHHNQTGYPFVILSKKFDETAEIITIYDQNIVADIQQQAHKNLIAETQPDQPPQEQEKQQYLETLNQQENQ